MDTASVHTYPKKTINENGTFENALQSTCGQTKTELFENAEDTLSVPIHSAEYIQDDGRALPFLVFYTWAYF